MRLITEESFEFEVPVPGIEYRIAKLNIAAGTVLRLYEGTPVILRLPVYEEVTSDGGTGSFTLTPQFFKPSYYWKPTQLIYVYDKTAGQALTYTSGTPSAGQWTYDEGTNTVTGVAPTAGDKIRVYYIPYIAPVKIEYEMRRPDTGKTRKAIYRGVMSDFVHTDLKREKPRLEGSAVLDRRDILEIKVKSPSTNVVFNPFLPDGSTLVPIVEISMYADIISEL